MRADLILRLLQKKHENDIFFTQVKSGPTTTAASGELLILDGLAIKPSYANPFFTGYEVKVSKGDFKGDSKWIGYLKLCHRFYFVSPEGVIDLASLEETSAGLIWVVGDKLVTKKRPAVRDIEIPNSILLYLTYSKLDKERHPFFTTEDERNCAWLEHLGWRQSVRDKVEIEAVRRYNEVASQLERALDELRLAEGERDGFISELVHAGVSNANRWGLRQALRERDEARSAHSGSVPLRKLDGLRRMAEEIAAEFRKIDSPKDETEED